MELLDISYLKNKNFYVSDVLSLVNDIKKFQEYSRVGESLNNLSIEANDQHFYICFIVMEIKLYNERTWLRVNKFM